MFSLGLKSAFTNLLNIPHQCICILSLNQRSMKDKKGHSPFFSRTRPNCREVTFERLSLKRRSGMAGKLLIMTTPEKEQRSFYSNYTTEPYETARSCIPMQLFIDTERLIFVIIFHPNCAGNVSLGC
ncbi:hypothetical protein TNCV_883941 [Trichonephila clavipes]|nr:hypothetical protein TNCV_883941 [Trichonephila clavipes]